MCSLKITQYHKNRLEMHWVPPQSLGLKSLSQGRVFGILLGTAKKNVVSQGELSLLFYFEQVSWVIWKMLCFSCFPDFQVLRHLRRVFLDL